MERVTAYCGEREALRRAEDKAGCRARTERERARAEIERLRSKYYLSRDNETQTPPDQLLVLQAENEELKLEPLSTVLVKHKNDTDLARIDKLLVVCSALTNHSASVVP